jgi:hypothetical protein
MSISKIQAESINLADTFSFTGNVSGAFTGVEKITETVLDADASYVTFTSSGTPNIFDTKYRKVWFHFTNVRGIGGTGTNYFLKMNATTDGTNYDVNKTTTFSQAYQSEGNTSGALAYQVNYDITNSQSDATIQAIIGDEADEGNGFQLFVEQMHSTTSKKPFYGTGSTMTGNNTFNYYTFMSGYYQTTSALTGIRFRVEMNGGSSHGMSDGSIVAVYGIV